MELVRANGSKRSPGNGIIPCSGNIPCCRESKMAATRGSLEALVASIDEQIAHLLSESDGR